MRRIQSESAGDSRVPSARTRSTVVAAEVEAWVTRLARGAGSSELDSLGQAELLDLVTGLERLKNAAAAAQARVGVTFDQAVRREAVAEGESPDGLGGSIGAQLALARRESPHRGSRHLGLAKAVVLEMPHTHAALTDGVITEWTATLLVRETACLSVEDRGRVDARLAHRLGRESDRALGKAAAAAAYELDPHSFVTRGRKAVADRRVTIRPAPDVMSLLTAFLPAAQGVACHAALDQAARQARATGDERSLDQIKADTLVARITGQATAEDVSVEIGLVMTDAALLGAADTPAHLSGYGPIPAGIARDLVHPDRHGCGCRCARGGSHGSESVDGARRAKAWVRRLFTDPVTGQVQEQDGKRRTFPARQRRFLVARDQHCRTPYCTAPIRHGDHVVPHREGGPTTRHNGQGLCEQCSYTKETPGWKHEVVANPMGVHTVRITTPTGHTYLSRPPPVLDACDGAHPGAGRAYDDTG